MEQGGTSTRLDVQHDIALDTVVFMELASLILAERAGQRTTPGGQRDTPHAGTMRITLTGTRSGDRVQSCPHETDT